MPIIHIKPRGLIMEFFLALAVGILSNDIMTEIFHLNDSVTEPLSWAIGIAVFLLYRFVEASHNRQIKELNRELEEVKGKVTKYRKEQKSKQKEAKKKLRETAEDVPFTQVEQEKEMGI
jgi:TolA-binding protein